MNRYDFYPGDYLRDTTDLSAIEDGIYLRLLNWYYSNERPIENERCYAVARASNLAEKRAVKSILNRFFLRRNDLWVHERAEREIEKAFRKSESAQNNGKRGGRPKKEKPTGFSVGSENPTNKQTETEPNIKPKPNPDAKLPSPSPLGSAAAAPGNRSCLENRTKAESVPLLERCRLLVAHEDMAQWCEPHCWSELVRVSDEFCRLTGIRAGLGNFNEHGVKSLVTIFAAGYSPDDVCALLPGIVHGEWWSKKPRRLASLSVDVLQMEESKRVNPSHSGSVQLSPSEDRYA